MTGTNIHSKIAQQRIENSQSMNISGKKILLTGGAGFIGSALVKKLVDANEVVVFDNGHRNALKGSKLLDHPNLRVVWGDVLDLPAVRNVVEGCNIVVHLAAIAGVDTVLKMPVTTMRVNIIGTYHLLEAMIDSKHLERFIDFSTSEVFGSYAYKVREGDITSLGAVGEARWTYAVSKLATEHMAHNYHKQYGTPTVSIRPFNIYGPGQVGEGAIHNFIVRAINDKPIEIHNEGSQIRAWCYIDDIVEGILLCMYKPDAVGHVFNIGNPRSVITIYQLAKLIANLSRSKSPIVRVDWPFPDVELRIPDISKARELLGYEPTIELESGIEHTIEWYRSQSHT